MPQLTLLLLGPPRVEIDGVAVRFDTRKALALLARLALADGPLRRDTLATLLWPEYAQGRAALRRTLSALQAAIGDRWLVSARDEIALRRDPAYHCDVDLFHAYITVAQDALLAAQIDALRAAISLYRDDFLTGFTLRDSPAFDDWQLAQADHLRRTLAETLERLAACEVQSGDSAAAIASTRRRLELDPLHEQAHCALMTLYAQAGQRSLAVQQYRDCVRLLERELGVPPLEETTSLYHAIVAGTLPAPHGRSDVVAPAPYGRPDVVAPAPYGRPDVVAHAATPALVGRDAEWATLLHTYANLGPNGTVIALTGPAGIGKTRLATELLAQARTQGAITLQVRCYEGETGLAFAPFVAILRTICALPDAAARLAAIPDWLRSAAAHLVPELAERPAVLPPNNADARLRLFEGVAAVLFTAITGSTPAIVLFDDLQWADDASLELFAFLARRLHGQPLGLAATWRDDDLPSAHPLRGLSAALRRDGAVVGLHLAPLSRPAVSALLQAMPDAANLPADTDKRLFSETEGLPLLVVAYLDMLRERDLPPTVDPWEVPGVARDLLQARIRRASAMGIQLLAAAAVIGRTFDSTLLRAVSGRSDEEIVVGLEELISLGIVVEGLSYDFSHGKLRDLVYAETSLARRRLLHRRAAEALAQHPAHPQEGAHAALIGQHYQLAGQDELAALAYARAGQYARELAATGTALSHYRTALALGHPDPAPIHTAIGDLCTLEGQYDQALAGYETAVTVAETHQIATLEARIAEVHRRRGEWPLALRHLEAALAALDPSGEPGQRAQLTADYGITAYQSGDVARAGQLAQAALDLALQAGDQRALAQAHNLHGLLARAANNPGEACAHLECSLTIAEHLGDRDARTAALHNLALAKGDASDLDSALAYAAKALQLCEAVGDRHRAAAIHNTIADLLHASGRAAEAMEQLKQAVALFAAIGGDANRKHPGIWQLTAW
jgi:DNA-binding SARP family transcriptional activator